MKAGGNQPKSKQLNLQSNPKPQISSTYLELPKTSQSKLVGSFYSGPYSAIIEESEGTSYSLTPIDLSNSKGDAVGISNSRSFTPSAGIMTTTNNNLKAVTPGAT